MRDTDDTGRDTDDTVRDTDDTVRDTGRDTVTRFPPEPSGMMHLGHAKAALVNRLFADERGGRMLVRFDDTNPAKCSRGFEAAILEDLERLGIAVDGVSRASDHFDELRDVCERMVAAGSVYADDTPPETMRAERTAGIESRRRAADPAESLAVWRARSPGWCMRVKLDPHAANKALRDPVAFRLGDDGRWFPTYDFACPFLDAVQGVTHVLRTDEFRDRDAQFQRILELQRAAWPGLPEVSTGCFARLAFQNTVLSKRALGRLVAAGAVDGWDDPRMPTVRGLLRRGLQPGALREFVRAQGDSLNATCQSWDKIWAVNRRQIDLVSPRYAAVVDGLALTVTNGPREPEPFEVPRHPKNPAMGTRARVRSNAVLVDTADAIQVDDGEVVTLMGWGACRVAWPRAEVLPGHGCAKTRALTWLAACDAVPVELWLHDELLTKKVLGKADDPAEHVVPRTVVPAACEASILAEDPGSVVQLERKGFFVVDSRDPLVLIEVPTGRGNSRPWLPRHP